MTLKLIPAGLDFGNGWIKLACNGLVSKIPNWSIAQKPKGELNIKTMLAANPMAFSLEINGTPLWFGQDTLSEQGYQEIDEDKYKPEYIRGLFKAILYRWLTQSGKGRVEADWLKERRLHIVCGMPPEQYQDRSTRNRAEKAYRQVFNQNKPDYIKVPNQPAIPFFTAFGGLKPETLSWKATHRLKAGYTLVVDLGYGTSDLVLFHDSRPIPVSTVSLPNGLIHSHNDTNPTSPWTAELDTMRKTNIPSVYSNATKAKIRTVARQIELVQLVVFGGGIKLFSKQDIMDLKSYAADYWQGDEFTNAKAFEGLGRYDLENRE